MKKKVLSGLLALTMCLGLLPGAALAAEHTCEDLLYVPDHFCDICFERMTDCVDENPVDHFCDFCSARMTKCVDEAPADHVCDICLKKLTDCVDEDPADHVCDVCLEALAGCADEAPADHACDVCLAVLTGCADEAPADHFCDVCLEMLTDCTDEDHDHICDVCGAFPVFADEDGDKACDACGAAATQVSVEYTALSYRMDDEENVLASGTLAVAVDTVNAEAETASGSVQAVWVTRNEEEYTFSAELTDGEAEIAFTDLPASALSFCQVTYTPDSSGHMLSDNGRFVRDDAGRVSALVGSADYTVNGMDFDLWLLPGTEVTVALQKEGNDVYTLTFDEYSAEPEYTRDGNIITFTMPEGNVDLIVQWMTIKVGGTQVTAANATDVLGDGTVRYDAVTNTLTLDGADIAATEGYYGIYCDNDLNIRLNGDNKVTCSGYYGLYTTALAAGSGTTGSLTITGSGTLDVSGSDLGIYTVGNDIAKLTICGEVTVTARGGDVVSGSSYGIRAGGPLTISNGAVVTAISGYAPVRSCAIYAYDSIDVLNGAVVTATGGEAVKDSYGIRTTYIDIVGSELTATGSKAGSSSHGIFTQTFRVDNSTVVGKGGEVASGPSIGIQTNANTTGSTLRGYALRIESGTVTGIGGEAGGDQSCGIQGNGSMYIYDGTVAGICGNGQFARGISGDKLLVEGGTITAEANGGSFSYGIQVDGELTVTGGEITAVSGDAERFSYGMMGFTVDISGGTVYARGGNGGIWAMGPVTITGGEVTADGNASQAIYSMENVDLGNYWYHWISEPDGQLFHSAYMPIRDVSAYTYLHLSRCNDAVYTGSGSAAPEKEETPAGNIFEDVAEDAYYAEAVEWAVANDVTRGTAAGTFAPHTGCTRAQAVTFLWRAAGCPEAGEGAAFGDVAEDAYYAEAVAWAVETGVTTGTTEMTFDPNGGCTRAQIVTFLWRAAGCPKAEGSVAFGDVAEDAYYAEAVAWAAEKGITLGTTADTFSPDAVCTRAQIMTFLYRSAG